MVNKASVSELRSPGRGSIKPSAMRCSDAGQCQVMQLREQGVLLRAPGEGASSATCA